MSVIHTACPWCGSRDNLSVWDNGSQKCFTPGCNFQVFSDPSSFPTMTSTKSTGQEIDPIVGEYVDIKTRSIKADTCQKAGYIKGMHGGEPAYFAPIYNNERVLTGYKIRKQGKNFLMHGTNPDNRFLFQEKWGGNNKLLVIFEGEYDALSYIQVRDWPAVSLPNGCESGNKVVRAQLSWLLTFETVIFCYDDDEHGRKAALRDVQLLPPRVGKIGTISGYKDANEALQAGDSKAIVSMVYQAKEYEPDGIVNGNTLLTPVLEDPKVDSIDYSFPCLNENILGARKGEMVVWCAGTGSGKSTAIGEQIYKFCVEQGQKVCVFNLEENNLRSARRYVGIHLNHPIHIDRGNLTDEQITKAFNETLGTGRLYLYDHFGSIDPTVLLNRIRYCVTSLGCDWVFLDHISILVSGMDQNQDERRAIDSTMTKLRSLVEETGCGMHVVSHLKRPTGDRGFEDGHKINVNSLRGSGSIGQLADIVLGLERDQQDGSSECKLRVMKNRFTGWLGVAGTVKYYEKTGRMLELDDTAVITDDFIEPDF